MALSQYPVHFHLYNIDILHSLEVTSVSAPGSELLQLMQTLMKLIVGDFNTRV